MGSLENPVEMIVNKAKEAGGGNFFSVGIVTSFSEDTYTASVRLPMMDDIALDNVRVGTDYVGDGFGLKYKLKDGDEVLVCFPSGDPLQSDAVILKRFWGKNQPPASGIVDTGADMILENEDGARITLKLGLLRFLTEQVEIGKNAIFHLVLAEPFSLKFNTHVHTWGPLIPTTPMLPPFLMTGADQTDNVTVMK